jgi:hypothetical protein
MPADNLKSSQEARMGEAELANAAWWAWFWGVVEQAAFFGVVLTLAIEFAALKAGAPYKAKLESAKELKIAELNNETARLRKQVGPRQINGEEFKKKLEGKPAAPVEIMFPREDIEAFHLAIQFRDVLRMSGWEAPEPVPVPPGDVPRLLNQPSIASVGANSAGVTVVMRADTNADFERLRDLAASTPLNALIQAISSSLGGAGAAAAGPDVFHVPPPGVLRIVVGPKP